MARSVVRAHILQAHDKRMPTLHTTLLGASGLALQGGEGASCSGIPASPRTRALGIREAASLHRLQRPPANHTRPPPCALDYLIQKQEEAVFILTLLLHLSKHLTLSSYPSDFSRKKKEMGIGDIGSSQNDGQGADSGDSRDSGLLPAAGRGAGTRSRA